jgi:hypothetical protein
MIQNRFLLTFLLCLCCLVSHGAQSVTNVSTGSGANTGTGIPLRTAFGILNTNDVFLAATKANNTNAALWGNTTNVNGDVIMSASDDGTGSGHKISWYSLGHEGFGTALGGLWFNWAHPYELQMDSVRSFSLNLGGDGQQNGVGQLGTSGETHEIFCLQYDKIPTGVAPLGYSKFLSWVTRYYNGGQLDRHPGFRSEALDNNGNVELAFYSSFKEFSQAVDDPFSRKIGGFGTNNFHYQNFICTNAVLIGSGAGGGIGSGPQLTAGGVGLDVSCGSYPCATFGADLSGTTRTLNGNKYALIGFAPKDNGSPTVGFNYSTAGGFYTAGNWLAIGGGTGALPALQSVEVYTAASQGSTANGTPNLSINSTTINLNDLVYANSNLYVSGSQCVGTNSIDPTNTFQLAVPLGVPGQNRNRFCIHTNGTVYASGSAIVAGSVTIGGGTAIQAVYYGTGTLDFGSTSAQTSADLTITVTGAAAGDPVTLAVPTAAVLANCDYTAWVSGANTVTVRLNNYSSSAKDPASGTFGATVFHH